MRHVRNALFLLLAGVPFLADAASVAYRIDPVHSQVVFNVDHNGFSRSFGRLRITDGTIAFDADDWSKSSVTATVDLTSVDMGDPEWDKAVRGPTLLDADRGGTARFVSESVEKRGEDEGTIHGRLTLRGTTLPLDIPFHVNRVGTTIYGLHSVAGFSAQVTLDRTAFGMTSNRNSIGTQVSVWLEIEGIRDGERTADTTRENADGAAK